MSKPFRTLDDASVASKRVLLRVDLNVPTENGRVTDTTRIERVASTIEELSSKGAKVILLAHFGRPKGGPDEANSLRPVSAAVEEIVKRPVSFAGDWPPPDADIREGKPPAISAPDRARALVGRVRPLQLVHQASNCTNCVPRVCECQAAG